MPFGAPADAPNGVEAGGQPSMARGRPQNLPAEITTFIGREREIRRVRELLATTRLLTLTGMGGVGKTRLALQVAGALTDAYADGVWLVELAALADPTLVADAVASALGLQPERTRVPREASVPRQMGALRPASGMAQSVGHPSPNLSPAPVGGGRHPLLATLADLLRPKQMLLVLDNCEHLVDACAALAGELLRTCPELRILATSREALTIAGETTWQVPPLSLPDPQGLPDGGEALVAALGQHEAVRLLVDRARSAVPAFAMTVPNAPAVGRLCRQLDGLPLAIELAAARLRALTVEEIVARLDDRFRLLVGGSRIALPRHQTLRALVDWSHDLLSDAERVLLRRLSVFAGGWTVEAAEAVCAFGAGDAGWAIGEGGEEPSSPPPPTPSPHPPFPIWELLSQLVDKSLVLADEQDGVTRCRLLETIRRYAAEKLPPSEEAILRGRLSAWILAMVEKTEAGLTGPEQVEALATLETEHDNVRLALGWYVDRGEAEPALRLAGALWRFWDVRGHLEEGRAWLARVLALPPTAPRTAGRAKALSGAGILSYLQGDYAVAQTFYDESLAIRRQLGDPRAVAGSLNNLGHLGYLRGDYAAARAVLEESATIARAVGDRFVLGYALSNLALLAYHEDNPRAARPLLEECLALFRDVGHEWGTAMALAYLGMVAQAEGDLETARGLYLESLARRRRMAARRAVAWSLNLLGRVATARGEYDAARAHLGDSLTTAREIGDRHGFVNALEGLVHRAAAQGRSTSALRLAAAAGALRGAIGLPLSPADRGSLVRALGPVRRALGAMAASVEAEGRAMSAEEAFTYALSVEDDAVGPPPEPAKHLPSAVEPVSLSRREREVVTLIARGLSNRQIGSELVISEGTVANHMKRILRKLGLDSRTQVAAWAARRNFAPAEPPRRGSPGAVMPRPLGTP